MALRHSIMCFITLYKRLTKRFYNESCLQETWYFCFFFLINLQKLGFKYAFFLEEIVKQVQISTWPPEVKNSTDEQKWRTEESKSNSITKFNYGDLRLNFTSTIHCHREALELVLIITPMGLLKVQTMKCLRIMRKN